jgi:NADPH-dependent glutamate synthase beta subunit-like oxidoreductase
VVQVSIRARPPDLRPPGNPWPAHPQTYEMTYAIAEGGEEVFDLNSARFVDSDGNGRVDAIEFERVRWSFDEHGNRRDKEVLESGIRVDADLVLIAAGFSGPEMAPFAGAGLATTSGGTIASDASMMTALPGVFVAGDARRGASLVVWAIGEGRDVARAIDCYLTGVSRLPASLATHNAPLRPRGL